MTDLGTRAFVQVTDDCAKDLHPTLALQYAWSVGALLMREAPDVAEWLLQGYCDICDYGLIGVGARPGIRAGLEEQVVRAAVGLRAMMAQDRNYAASQANKPAPAPSKPAPAKSVIRGLLFGQGR